MIPPLMKEQFLALAELRKIDEKAQRLQKELNKIPKELKDIQDALALKKEIFLKVKAEVDGYEKKVRDLELSLKEKEDFLKKAESKMMEVKTNDEYKAAMKENEGHKTEKAKIEESLLVLMNGVETERKKLAEAQSIYKEFETTATKDTAEIETERAKLSKLYEEQLEKRKAAATKLAGNFQTIYHKITNRNTGTAIEIVDQCMCQGCNIRVRTQLYNEVLGMKALHNCPNCGRILISQQLDTELVG